MIHHNHHAPKKHGMIPCRVTNYQDNGSLCADGHRYGPRAIAASRSFPFGTRVAIQTPAGVCIYTVHDRGGAVQGLHHFDMATAEMRRRFHLGSNGTAKTYYRIVQLGDGKLYRASRRSR